MTQTVPATLKVLSTLAISAPLPELADRFRQSTGIALDVEQARTTVLSQRVASGVRADVIVLGKDELDRLVREGTLDAESAADLVRSYVGIAVRSGAPKPPIATAEEFVAALRNARSVVYSRSGASGIFFAGLVQRLGIANEINAKATIVDGGLTGRRWLAARSRSPSSRSAN